MTTPITKAEARKLWKASHYEFVRTHDPQQYASLMRQEQRRSASQQFFGSDEGKTLLSDLEAWLTTPDMQAEMAKWDQLHRSGQFAAEYTLLGIEAGATKRDVKNAYRRQARRLHPDKGGDEAAMKQLNAAYKRLLAIAKE